MSRCGYELLALVRVADSDVPSGYMRPATQLRLLRDSTRLLRNYVASLAEAYVQDEARTRAAEAAKEGARRSRCPRPDKRAWGTQEGAQGSVRSLRANGCDPDLRVAAYLCGCGAWHVGRSASVVAR